MKTKKVGLFGGSFNPIHNHHLKIIKYLINKKLVDEVWIIPCKNHPFNKQLAEAKHRINMIKLVIQNPKVKICDVELKSKGKNYTIKTVRKLKSRYSHKFFCVIGSDIFHEMTKRWYGIKQLKKEIEFIVFKRKGYTIIKIPDMKIAYLINKNETEISSTEIREKIGKGKPLKNLVPSPVEEYIKKHGLYKKLK